MPKADTSPSPFLLSLPFPLPYLVSVTKRSSPPTSSEGPKALKPFLVRSPSTLLIRSSARSPDVIPSFLPFPPVMIAI
jgi:hypothetical protein